MTSKSKIYTISDDDFKIIFASSTSFSDLAKRIGLKVSPWVLDQLRIRASDLNLDVSMLKNNFDTELMMMKKNHSVHRILEKDSKIANSYLKRLLIDSKLIPYKCAICGNEGMWHQKTLVLQLDHIDGNRHNNDISNLRFLCPNCHSQTTTYAGANKKTTENKYSRVYSKKHYYPIKPEVRRCDCCRNKFVWRGGSTICRSCLASIKRRKGRPSAEEMLEKTALHGISQTASEYNVDSGTIRLWLRDYHLPWTKKEIVNAYCSENGLPCLNYTKKPICVRLVKALDKDTKAIIGEYMSPQEANKALKCHHAKEVCDNKRHSEKGIIFIYAPTK